MSYSFFFLSYGFLRALRVSVVNPIKKPRNAKGPGANKYRRKIAPIKFNSFLYPDYTVDPGISPDRALARSWVITTDRELGPASRTLPRRIYAIVEAKYSPAGRGRQEGGACRQPAIGRAAAGKSRDFPVVESCLRWIIFAVRQQEGAAGVTGEGYAG